jgi:hypothetical protein
MAVLCEGYRQTSSYCVIEMGALPSLRFSVKTSAGPDSDRVSQGACFGPRSRILIVSDTHPRYTLLINAVSVPLEDS